MKRNALALAAVLALTHVAFAADDGRRGSNRGPLAECGHDFGNIFTAIGHGFVDGIAKVPAVLDAERVAGSNPASASAFAGSPRRRPPRTGRAARHRGALPADRLVIYPVKIAQGVARRVEGENPPDMRPRRGVCAVCSRREISAVTGRPD